MAGDSLLSIKGKVSWMAGDHSNVINSTKRMMSGMNTAITGEMRAGQRAREGVIQEGLNKIEKEEQQSAKRLLKNKQTDAQRLSDVRVKARTPPKVTSRSSAEVKKRANDINQLVKAGELAHAKLKQIQKRAGVDVSKTKAWSAGEFAEMDAGGRAGSIGRMRQATEELTTELGELKETKDKLDYHKDRKEYLAVARAIDEKTQSIEESKEVTGEAIRLDKKWSNFEYEHREELKKTGAAKQKLYKMDKEIYRTTIQMERDLRNASREVAEEMGRVRQEAGEGLRNAFMFATVAITAFWYKLQPLVETFKEFESELVNAQSIWQNSQADLNELSDQVVQFGQKFGIEMGKATEGLYQYASAGVEAAEAMQMLNHTLTLSMAVQGDHNTLAKLTTQTIMGFGMEFDQAAEVTDKFAHAINMSLIEWDDLASSIKFALPFFTSTGQSLDQLLGALSVLTNRALEAGIAGRGLRQALAEFAQHADDNSAAFAKMGVEILDNEGNMKQLTDIASQFQEVMGEGVNDMDVMMALMEDLNIRGATAFVHLVQNADEFQAQVDDLQNSAGASARMAEIQQKSLANQIQLVKNAMEAPFLMSDKVGEAAGYTNEFALQLHSMTKAFESLIVVEVEGTKQLTEFGQFIKDFVIQAMRELYVLITNVRDTLLSFGNESEAATSLMHMFTVPLNIVVNLFRALGPGFIQVLFLYKLFNKLMPVSIMNVFKMIAAEKAQLVSKRTMLMAQLLEIKGIGKVKAAKIVEEMGYNNVTAAMWRQVAAQMVLQIGMFAVIAAVRKWGMDSWQAAAGVGFLAGAFGYLAVAATAALIALQQGTSVSAWFSGGATSIATMAAGVGMVTALIGVAAQQTMKAPDIPEFQYEEYATGGRVGPYRNALTSYATGGRAGGTGGTHFPVMVESGETIISKTQNMANGGAGGVTIQIHGDVYDGENFAEKVGNALPKALRKADDRGIGLVTI